MTRSSLISFLVPLSTLLSVTTADFIPYPNGTPTSTLSYNILTALEAAGVATTDLPSVSNTPATDPADTTTTFSPTPTTPPAVPSNALVADTPCDVTDIDSVSDARATATPSHAPIAIPTGANITVLSLANVYNKTTDVKFPNSTNTDHASTTSKLLKSQDLSNTTDTNTTTTANNSTLFTSAATAKNGTFASLPSSISKLRLTNSNGTTPLNGTGVTNSTLPAIDAATNGTVDSASSSPSAAVSPPLPFLPASSTAASPSLPDSTAAVVPAPSTFATSASEVAGVSGTATAASASLSSSTPNTGFQQQQTAVVSGGQKMRVRSVMGAVAAVMVIAVIGWGM